VREYPGPLIRSDAEDPDLTYRTLRDNHKRSDDRQFAERLWSTYWPFADNNFFVGIPRDFAARFWEMDLACVLLRLNFVLEERRRHGPDICIGPPGRRVWIEAVAPTDGDGPNASPGLDCDLQARTFAGENGILLRFRNAVDAKVKKYQGYRNDGIIGPKEPYVIALNGSRVSASLIEGDLPWIVKAVYPFGEEQIRIDVRTEAVSAEYEYRPAIRTAVGSEVATDLFLGPECAGISGILYSRTDVWNRRDDYIFVHNLKATNPLDRGWLPLGTEYWPDSNALHLTRHTGASTP
jgi:hypothetical protein